MLGYDVKNGKMYVNEEGAEVVRKIFYKFVLERKSTHTIAKELLEEGIYPMRSKKWRNTVILRILQNEDVYKRQNPSFSSSFQTNLLKIYKHAF